MARGEGDNGVRQDDEDVQGREKSMIRRLTERTRKGQSRLAMAILLLSGMAMVVAGCGVLAAESQTLTEKEARQPFSARRESEDGAVVEWSGYVDGYAPGMRASFDIGIRNQTDEAWPGRFCLQLMDDDPPKVMATLEQGPFNLAPGLAFSDTITTELPTNLDEGAYALSFVVRRDDGPTVDLVPISVGDAEEGTTPRGQRAMDAALEACPPVTGARWEPDNLVTLAKEDLAEHAGVDVEEIVVKDVKEAEFPDASLGVPEPGKTYAQVVTPGFVIQLQAGAETYRYHAAGDRAVLAVEDAGDLSSD